MQQDAVPENTKAMKFGLNVFKGSIEKTYRRSTFEQFQNMSLEISDFINLSKPDR